LQMYSALPQTKRGKSADRVMNSRVAGQRFHVIARCSMKWLIANVFYSANI